MGRHTYLTDSLADRLVTVVRAGSYFRAAAKHVGIAEVTLYTWIKRGKTALAIANRDEDTVWAEFPEATAEGRPDPIFTGLDQVDENEQKYVKLILRLDQAEGEAEVRAVTRWTSDRSWRAQKEYLARRHPDRWGARVEMDITHHDEGGDDRELPERVANDDERSAKVIEALEEAAALPPGTTDQASEVFEDAVVVEDGSGSGGDGDPAPAEAAAEVDADGAAEDGAP